MRKVELLIDALEQDGHAEIRIKINEIEEALKAEFSLGRVLTPDEVQTVQKTLNAYEPPTPKNWSQALMIHAIKKSIHSFSPDRPYTLTELGNLTTTLYHAGLSDPEILRKIIKAGDKMKRYDNGVEPP
jgi:hypothetical protein